jgi:hypothetical protein
MIICDVFVSSSDDYWSTSTPAKDGVIIIEMSTLLKRSGNTVLYVYVDLACYARLEFQRSESAESYT